MTLQYAKAICYSGYRQGQSPMDANYPSHIEIEQDLRLLCPHWQYIRLYDCGPHAERVLHVIKQQKLPIKVMLGMDLAAEESNPNCPWGAQFSYTQLQKNQLLNQVQLKRCIELATLYPHIINAVSIGNEASVDWTDHLVSVDALINYVKQLKAHIRQPVTFCENYVPWQHKLAPLVDELDFISIHTYPVWEYKSIEHALAYTQENYNAVKQCYPNKQVIITEAGWATNANGRGIEPWNANPELQTIYIQQLSQWTEEQQITTYLFEAFDEDWKGSQDPSEPEKHWGLFYIDRTPKPVMSLFSQE